MFNINAVVFWNSPKGYSLKNERVTVIQNDPISGKVFILSEPDSESDSQASYWVEESELSVIPFSVGVVTETARAYARDIQAAAAYHYAQQAISTYCSTFGTLLDDELRAEHREAAKSHQFLAREQYNLAADVLGLGD